jgi:hypothetical protein
MILVILICIIPLLYAILINIYAKFIVNKTFINLLSIEN